VRHEIEMIAGNVADSRIPSAVWRTVVDVQGSIATGRGGTCTVADGLGNQSFGVRWFDMKPVLGDVVLVSVPPPSGTRYVIHVDRQQSQSDVAGLTTGDAPAFAGVTVPGVTLTEGNAPSTPASGLHVLYAISSGDRGVWAKTSDGSIHAITAVGQQPFALTMGLGHDSVQTGNFALVANGGAIMVPILLVAPMTLYRIAFRGTDTTLLRTAEWGLYVDRQDGTANLYRVATGTGFSFTAAAAANRTDTPTTNPLLAPGMYWLVIRNTHASNTLGIGSVAQGTLGTTFNTCRVSTSVGALGATLATASFAANSGEALTRIEGRIVNETGAF
jgi:hypothetical protein